MKHSLFSFCCLAATGLIAPISSVPLYGGFGSSIAYAQDAPKAEQKPESETQAKPSTNEEKLDALFAKLVRERNEAKADRISKQIWRIWFESGSRTVDLLMRSSQSAVEARQFSVAMDLLDQILVLEPNYAEGWNRRATLHFMLKDNAKSLRDIEQTLFLEPRHFGALAGLGGILLSRGERERALEIYLRALEIYPMMRGAQAAVAQITEELASEKL